MKTESSKLQTPNFIRLCQSATAGQGETPSSKLQAAAEMSYAF